MLSLTVYGESMVTVSQGCCGKCVVEKGVDAYDLFSVPQYPPAARKELLLEWAFETVFRSC